MNQYWNSGKWGARSWRRRCWKVPLFSAYVNVICWYDVLINLGCVGVLLVCYKDLSGKKRRSWTKRKPRAKWYLIKRGLSYNIYVRREKRHFSAASSPASSPSFSSISSIDSSRGFAMAAVGGAVTQKSFWSALSFLARKSKKVDQLPKTQRFGRTSRVQSLNDWLFFCFNRSYIFALPLAAAAKLAYRALTQIIFHNVQTVLEFILLVCTY